MKRINLWVLAGVFTLALGFPTSFNGAVGM